MNGMFGNMNDNMNNFMMMNNPMMGNMGMTNANMMMNNQNMMMNNPNMMMNNQNMMMNNPNMMMNNQNMMMNNPNMMMNNPNMMMNNQNMMMNNGNMMMNNPNMMMNNPMMMNMMMMNNNNMMGNMQGMGSDGLDDQKGWNLIFENQSDGKTYTITISEQKTVKEAINRYRLKSMRTDNCKFIFNNKELFAELKICESGLSNLSRILVISLQGLKGAKI